MLPDEFQVFLGNNLPKDIGFNIFRVNLNYFFSLNECGGEKKKKKQKNLNFHALK